MLTVIVYIVIIRSRNGKSTLQNFNHLKHEIRLIKNSSSLTDNTQYVHVLPLFREIIAVHCKSRTKPITTLCRQKSEFKLHDVVHIVTFFFFFFFFFSRRYNPWWILACFTISFYNLLSLHFSLQFLTFTFFKSSSTW